LIYLASLFAGDSNIIVILFWFSVHLTFEIFQAVADYRTKNFGEMIVARYTGWNLLDTVRLYL